MQTPNLKYINELAEEDEAFKQNVIEVLKIEFPKEVAVFHKNYHANDVKGIVNIVHKMKYKFSLLGLENDFNLATEFEKEVGNDNKELFTKFENVLLKIDRYLKTI